MRVAACERASVSGRSRTRTGNAQRDPARDQHDTDDGRNMLAVTGLNPELRISNLNALRLGVGDWNDQGGNAERNQEQACKQQHFHFKSFVIAKCYYEIWAAASS
jgi:hypothetical protein